MEEYKYNENKQVKSNEEIQRIEIQESIKESCSEDGITRCKGLNDEMHILNILEKDINEFSFVEDEFKKNKDFMIKAVALHQDSLFYALDNLQDDEELVLKAVSSHPAAVRHASERLKNSQIIAKEVLKKNTFNYQLLGDDIKSKMDF